MEGELAYDEGPNVSTLVYFAVNSELVIPRPHYLAHIELLPPSFLIKARSPLQPRLQGNGGDLERDSMLVDMRLVCGLSLHAKIS